MKSLITKKTSMISGTQNKTVKHSPTSQSVCAATQATLRNILRPHGLQAKLNIGRPGDQYEQEADSVADRIVTGQPIPEISTLAPGSLQSQTEEEDEELLQPRLQRQPLEEEEELLQPYLQRQPLEEEEEELIQPYLQRQSLDEEEEEMQMKSMQGQGKNDRGTNVLSRVQEIVRLPGRPLNPETKTLYGPRYGYDFSQVRVHVDDRSSKIAREINARAFTVGNDVVFGAGQYSPETTQGNRLLAHELTHVVQQNSLRSQGHSVSRNVLKHTIQKITLSNIPLRQRLALQIRTQRPRLTAQVIGGFFRQVRPGSWGTTISSPCGASVQLGPGVPTNLQTPLTTVAGHLNNISITQAQQTAPLLGPNTVVTVRMNLTNYGGAAGLYRFTLYNVPASGRGGNLLIESLSSGPPQQQQASYTAGSGGASGTIAAGGQTFHLVGTQSLWTQARIASVRQALSLMPANVLTRAAGLRIGIQSGGLGTGIGSRDEGGHYDPNTDTVTLYRAIWGQVHRPGSLFASGQQVRHSNPVQVIAHEIAHAIDRRPLRRAEQTYQQSGQTAADLRRLLAARGLSGGRYVISGGGYGFSDVLTTTRGNTFRQAYIRDGASVSGGSIRNVVTMYGAHEWQEVYAEAFSLYIVDPEALRQVRPHVYQYFVAHFPRRPPAVAPGTAAPAQPSP